MERQSYFAVIAVALVLVATIGAAFLYAENNNLRQERDVLAVREELPLPHGHAIGRAGRT